MNANAMPEPTVSIEEESERTLDSETSESREQIRRQVLAERAALPKPYRLHKSSAICDELETSLVDHPRNDRHRSAGLHDRGLCSV